MPPVCLMGADRCSSWDGPGTSGSALNRDDQPEQLQPGQRRGDVPGGESDLLGDPTLSQPGTWRDRVQHPAVGGAEQVELILDGVAALQDRKSTRLNSSHVAISYAVF